MKKIVIFVLSIIITLLLSSCVLDSVDKTQNKEPIDPENSNSCDDDFNDNDQFKDLYFIEECENGDEYTYKDGTYHGVFKSKMGNNEVHEGAGIIFTLVNDIIASASYTSIYFQRGDNSYYGEYYTYKENNPNDQDVQDQIDAFENQLQYFIGLDINDLLSDFEESDLDVTTGATGKYYPYMFIGDETSWSTAGAFNLGLSNSLTHTEFITITGGNDDYSTYN